MCGIVGIHAHQRVNQDIFDALTIIQHRGQDAAGMLTTDGNQIFLRKHRGLVREVIKSRHMLRLQGNMGIGHVRYPTAGSESSAEAQPMYVNSPYGLCIVHNGNLTNAEELKQDLVQGDRRHLNTHSDSEVLLNVFAHELQLQQGAEASDVFAAVSQLHKRCQGAYSVIILLAGQGLVAFRDPHGIRPLCYGMRRAEGGSTSSLDYMFSSESVALDALGYELIDDVQPGEAIFINKEGGLFKQQCASNPTRSPCLFEYVYLARPDSVIDHIPVHRVRLLMGTTLAQRILTEWPEHDIDVVIPIPDTSRTAALPLAQRLGVNYSEGFVKNRYVGRTFIMPGQQQRSKSVRQKLNAISIEFQNKNVLLVDDSIVRGTTSKQIIQMAREAGAKKVYFASAAPEVRYPNVYGIDMPAVNELIAHQREIDEIARMIGADRLIFQRLEDLYAVMKECNPKINRFEDAVFTGDYVTGGVDDEYLKRLQVARADQAKARHQSRDQSGDDEHALDIDNV